MTPRGGHRHGRRHGARLGLAARSARGSTAGTNARAPMTEWDATTDLPRGSARRSTASSRPRTGPRKQLRSMGRVSQLAVRATELALADAGLLDDAVDTRRPHGRRLRILGRQHAANQALRQHAADRRCRRTQRQFLYPHDAAHRGGERRASSSGSRAASSRRPAPAPRAARASATPTRPSASGRQTLMLAGGAEELCASEAIAFDIAVRHQHAQRRSRNDAAPYDRDRDGLVIGEGAAMLVLEELDTRARAARAFMRRSSASPRNSDGAHVTRPDGGNDAACHGDGARRCRASRPDAIGYVNGHGTATEHGDIAETQATSSLFGSRHPDQLAEELPRPHARRLRRARGLVQHRDDERRLVRADAQPGARRSAAAAISTTSSGGGRELDIEYVMNNNFAFGGVNTSLIFRNCA